MKNQLLYFLCVLLPVLGISQTDVTNNIVSPTVWTKSASPYIIKNNIDVISDLTIEGGVEIKVDGWYKIAVLSNGKIITLGTETDSITFKSNLIPSSNKDWQSLSFENTTSPTELKYCAIQNIGVGIRLNNATLTLKSCSVTDNDLGMYLQTSNNTLIIDSSLFDNNKEGIMCATNQTPNFFNTITISNSSFKHSTSGHGVFTNYSNTNIDHCFFIDFAEGVRYDNGTGSVTNSELDSCSYGIVSDNSTITIEGNVIKNGALGIQLRGKPALAKIHCNSIFNHSGYSLHTFASGTENLGEIDAVNNYLGASNLTGVKKTVFDNTVDASINAWFKIEPFLYSVNGVTFVNQSADTIVALGNIVKLFVTVSESNLTYEWRKDGIKVIASSNVSGVSTDTLVIKSMDNSLYGMYTCHITSGCVSGVSSTQINVLKQACQATEKSDTAVYFVGSDGFKAMGSKVYAEDTLKLTSVNGCDSVIHRFSNYVYKAPQKCSGDTLFVVVSILGLNGKENIIKVFPNPTRDIIYINTGAYMDMSSYTVEIVSTQGQLVFKHLVDAQLFSVNVASFGLKGVYLLNIYDDSLMLVKQQKIILQ